MSFNTKPSQQPVSERRGQQLSPLRTNFSRPTSQIVNVASPIKQRPRPSDYHNSKAERVPLQPAHARRQTSRSSLRQIFSREKSARRSTDNKLSGIEEVQDPVSQAPAEPVAPLSPPISGAGDRPRAAAASNFTPAKPTLQPTHTAKTDGDHQPPAEDGAWKPPPLFKAYPQGLKHVTLPAPILSGDSILRLHATFKARGVSLQVDDKQARQPANEEPSEEYTVRKRKLDREKRKYLRALSDNIEKGEWTRKVYVIARSGYILQFSGEGKYDRLPEKMLLLGPKSVAFASDAIPGKHWVLQVSQGSEEDSSTIPAETSRHLLSRFRFHRSHARRLAQNLLLVFNDPEEMSSWLLAVRAQIETRGGKKYVSEKVYDDGMESQLRSPPSMRQLVKKDPNRFSGVFQPRQSMIFESKDLSVGDQSHRNSYISLHRRSMVMQPPPASRSGSVSTTQTEGTYNNPEEAVPFYATLRSPPPPDSSVVSETASSVTGPTSPTLSTFSAPRKRQSMFLPQMTNSEVAEIPRAQSTAPEAHIRSTSPTAPNFSVPVFSRRFAARQDIPHVPHLPSGYGDHQGDDTSIDTGSIFSSPPQSPSQEGFNAAAEFREQRRALDRRDQLKKQLRTSTSEDMLGNKGRDRDRRRVRYSYLPDHIAMTAHTTSLPRPAPINVKPMVPTAASHAPVLCAEAASPPSRREQPNRTDPQSRPSSLVMSRRKSLNGLTIGPAAPPPNCPLPKIPSAFVEPSPRAAWPVHSPPLSPVEDAEKALDNITPISDSHFPGAIRSTPSRQTAHKV